MKSPAEDIKDILVVDSAFTFGTNVFISTQPPTPISCVTIYDTSTIPPGGTLDGKSYFRDTVQILIRETTYTTAWETAMKVKGLLHNKSNFTLNNSRYLLIQLQNGPNVLRGNNSIQGGDTKGIQLVTMNFIIQRTSI
jgi:hypothetical protein